jgi:hypothetical protein
MKKFLRIIIAIIILPLWAILMMPSLFLIIILEFVFWVSEKPIYYTISWKHFKDEFFALYRWVRL